MLKTILKISGLLAALVLAVVIGVLAWLYLDAHRVTRGNADYVALGSSFAAAPGVNARDPLSPWLCMRSADNYAHLLARKRKIELADMTCSGATTHHVLEGGQFLQGPQIDALQPTTRLVTVTVGGNDIAYLGNLMAWSCRNSDITTSWLQKKTMCRETPQDIVDMKLRQLSASMLQIADVVKARSPHARLVFVDYTTVLPDAGSCPNRLPLTDTQLNRGRAVAHALQRITAETAKQSGALLVSAAELTQAHHLCSGQPWVVGWVALDLMSFRPVTYHPTAEAMHAIADQIDRSLTQLPVLQ